MGGINGPDMPSHNYLTWAIAAPPATHWRPATCAEVDCAAHRDGWSTTVDAGTLAGVEAVDWIRHQSGRRFRAERLPGSLVRFTFEAGQKCFGWRKHMAPVGRPEVFLRIPGHHSRYTGDRFVHTRPEHWRDEFGEHQLKLADAIKRG